MSPRSDELLEAARRRLKAAAAAAGEDPSGAISLAYYAMLYAARAALSEQADYEAWAAPTEDATRIMVTAGRFLEAVQTVLG